MHRCRLLSLVFVAVFSTQLRAEILFGFAASAPPPAGEFFWAPPTDPTAGTTRIVANAGDAIRISVFMLERGADMRLSDSGLVSAGFTARFDPSVGKVNSIIAKSLPFEAGVNPPTAAYRFNQGPDPTFDNVAGTLQINGAVDLNDQRIRDGNYPGRGSGAAFLGYFDFELTGQGETTFTFSDVNPTVGFSNNTLNDPRDVDPADKVFIDLDPELFASNGTSATTLTITTIPEPSSVFALSAICGVVAIRRRRRR